jgi:hypothetical protein
MAIDRYVYWLRALGGSETTVIEVKTNLDDIYASEKVFMGTGVRDPM